MRAALVGVLVLQGLLAASSVFALEKTECETAQSLIAAAEGMRLCKYTDTTGHPTICFGCVPCHFMTFYFIFVTCFDVLLCFVSAHTHK